MDAGFAPCVFLQTGVGECLPIGAGQNVLGHCATVLFDVWPRESIADLLLMVIIDFSSIIS